MLTLFAVPKRFEGPFGLIQRNAIRSWTLLEPRPEIVLLGDDPGTAELCAELRIRHVATIDRSEHGTPLVDGVFRAGQLDASGEVIAYVNADIVLLDDFVPAVDEVRRWAGGRGFLAVGRRWDLDLDASLDFSRDWRSLVRVDVLARGHLHAPSGMDYFVFPRGRFLDLPRFALGRTAWDNYLVDAARARGDRVVDCTSRITAVHQNHDYAHHPGGHAGVWKGEEAVRNLTVVRELRAYEDCCTADATHVLTRRGVQRAWRQRGLFPWVEREVRRQLGLHRQLDRPLAPVRRVYRDLRSRLTGGRSPDLP